MKKKLFLPVLLILLAFFYNDFLFAQKFSINGIVKDKKNQPLIGANVYISKKALGTSTDKKGKFVLKNLKPGKYAVESSMIGYKKRVDTVLISDSDVSIEIILEEDIIQTEQIIISGTKYKRALSDIPVSAEIISVEKLSQKNISSVDEALRNAPGVTFALDQISIRGSSGFSRGVGARALAAIDGIPLHSGDSQEIVWEILPINEINGIEILKSGQSSLYGSSAIGGVVNIITKDNSSYPLFHIKSSFGFYDKTKYPEWNWSKSLRTFNGQSISYSNSFKNLSFTANFHRYENLSYRQNDFAKRHGYYYKINYNIDSDKSFSVLGLGLIQNRGSFIYWKNLKNATRPPESDYGEKVASFRNLTALTYKTTITDKISFENKFAYYYTNWEEDSEASNRSSTNLYRNNSQINFFLDDFSSLICGIEFSYGKVNSNIFSNPKSYNFGSYAQYDSKLFNNLFLTGGIRFDANKNDTLSAHYSLSPKFGILYKFDQNLNLRFSTNSSFRAPSLSENFTQTSISGITVEPNPNLKPETAFSNEIGLTFVFFEKFNFDAALFYVKYNRLIEPRINPLNGKISFANIQNAHIYGTESSLSGAFFDNFLQSRISVQILEAKDLNSKKDLKYRNNIAIYHSSDLNFVPFSAGVDFRYASKPKAFDEELSTIVNDANAFVDIYVLDLRFSWSILLENILVKTNFNVKNLLNYYYIEMTGNLSPIRNFSLNVEMFF